MGFCGPQNFFVGFCGFCLQTITAKIRKFSSFFRFFDFFSKNLFIIDLDYVNLNGLVKKKYLFP